MIKYSQLLIFIILISCNQSKNPSIPQSQLIQNLTAKDNSIVGSIFGIRISDEVYSKFYIVKNADTILYIDSTGFRNPKKLILSVSTEDYDGWRIRSLDKDAVEIWLTKINGPSSDGATIRWIDSLKTFMIGVPGEEILVTE
jgi:hypothetical protein